MVRGRYEGRGPPGDPRGWRARAPTQQGHSSAAHERDAGRQQGGLARGPEKPSRPTGRARNKTRQPQGAAPGAAGQEPGITEQLVDAGGASSAELYSTLRNGLTEPKKTHAAGAIDAEGPSTTDGEASDRVGLAPNVGGATLPPNSKRGRWDQGREGR